MNYSPLSYLALFSTSAVVVGFLTPRFRSFALRRRIIDSPNSAHKTHVQPVPYLGGVAIAIGVVFTALAATALTDLSLLGLVVGILIPPVLLSVVGFIDDLKNLEPLPRFIAQTIVGVAVALILIKTDSVGTPTGSRTLDIAITILFIVGLSNSINFFDNIDGGASGTVAISTFFLAFFAYSSGQYYIAAISIVITGATLGFLWWNKSPARIYMGDAGSLFLGSLLASILIRFDSKSLSLPYSLIVILTLVAVPLLDTATVIISRISRKISPFQGGRDHLSHRLIRTGVSKVHSVFILWFLTVVFSIFSAYIFLYIDDHFFELSCIVIVSWLVALAIFLFLPATDYDKGHENYSRKQY